MPILFKLSYLLFRISWRAIWLWISKDLSHIFVFMESSLRWFCLFFNSTTKSSNWGRWSIVLRSSTTWDALVLRNWLSQARPSKKSGICQGLTVGCLKKTAMIWSLVRCRLITLTRKKSFLESIWGVLSLMGLWWGLPSFRGPYINSTGHTC